MGAGGVFEYGLRRSRNCRAGGDCARVGARALSMIRKRIPLWPCPMGGYRFSLEHNKRGKRLCGGHAQTKRSDHDPIQSDRDLVRHRPSWLSAGLARPTRTGVKRRKCPGNRGIERNRARVFFRIINKYHANSGCSWNKPLVASLIGLDGDSYVDTHTTLFRQAAGDRRETRSLLCGARRCRRREQSGRAILLAMALASSACDQQHNVGRHRLADLEVCLIAFDQSIDAYCKRKISSR